MKQKVKGRERKRNDNLQWLKIPKKSKERRNPAIQCVVWQISEKKNKKWISIDIYWHLQIDKIDEMSNGSGNGSAEHIRFQIPRNEDIKREKVKKREIERTILSKKSYFQRYPGLFQRTDFVTSTFPKEISVKITPQKKSKSHSHIFDNWVRFSRKRPSIVPSNQLSCVSLGQSVRE